MSAPDAQGMVELGGPIDVRRTILPPILLMPLPCHRRDGAAIEQAVWTEGGPSTIRYEHVSETAVQVQAWGPGAEDLVSAAPDCLGAADRPEEFAPEEPLLVELVRRHPGLRFGRSGRVWEHLLAAICGQRVTGKGAIQSVRDLIRFHGESAPRGLRTMPPPERIASLAAFHLVPCGLDAKRARTLIGCARHRKKLRRVAEMSARDADAFLQRFPGVGPWTSALVVSGALGDPDAVPVGDYNIPSLVTWNLRAQRVGDDSAMLALLEPFRPHRGRVIRLLAAGGQVPPRRGPRLEVRNIR